jgi:hypothetical protein
VPWPTTVFDPLTGAGMAGAAVLIVAYFANQQRWLRSEYFLFPLLNLVGSALIMASLCSQWNLPSVIIEAFWIGISLIGLLRSLHSRS